MAVTCVELELSRRIVENKLAEFLYLVQGTDDEATALATAQDTAPASYTFPYGSASAGDDIVLPRQPIEIEPVAMEAGAGQWQARVRYEDVSGSGSAPPQAEENVFSFETTGGTEKITQSKATIGVAVPASLSVPDFKGCIGWDGRNVNGCEITVPVFRWEETVYKRPASVDSAYRIACHNLTARTNNATFRGFPAGDVLFLGVRGSRRGRKSDDLWELTFSFAASPNGTNLVVGDITVPSKKGWEYLWVYYEDAVAGNLHAKRPRAAVVERVYDEGDFSLLGIGTSA